MSVISFSFRETNFLKINNNNNNNNNNLLTAIGLLPGGSSSVHVHNYEKGAKN